MSVGYELEGETVQEWYCAYKANIESTKTNLENVGATKVNLFCDFSKLL